LLYIPKNTPRTLPCFSIGLPTEAIKVKDGTTRSLLPASMPSSTCSPHQLLACFLTEQKAYLPIRKKVSLREIPLSQKEKHASPLFFLEKHLFYFLTSIGKPFRPVDSFLQLPFLSGKNP